MSQTLPVELDLLISRGLCLVTEDDDRTAFLLDLVHATERGLVSPSQARTLCEMVGIGPADHDAAQRRLCH